MQFYRLPNEHLKSNPSELELINGNVYNILYSFLQ